MYVCCMYCAEPHFPRQAYDVVTNDVITYCPVMPCKKAFRISLTILQYQYIMYTVSTLVFTVGDSCIIIFAAPEVI